MSTNRALLEEIKAAILINLQKWRYKDEVVLHDVLQKIEAELGKPEPEPEPDYWHVVDEDGLSIYTSSFKEACHDHIKDAQLSDDIYDAVEAAATWVVRPLWSKP